ncbi:MAG: hypothetical protein ACYC5O_02965 [Anaerolineae bacterium]
MTASPDPDLDAQFLLARLLDGTPMCTPPPLPTASGEWFASVGGRLWALFPWADGRQAREDDPGEHAYLAEAAADWVRAMEQVRRAAAWQQVVEAARAFRQRKQCAWAVPLDRVPQLTREIGAFWSMHGLAAAPEHAQYLAAIAALEDCLGRGLALESATAEAMVARFQAIAALPAEELAALPLLMAGYHLYYAVIHGLLYLEGQPEPSHTVRRIEDEIAVARVVLGR